jgi:hypothetical protein
MDTFLMIVLEWKGSVRNWYDEFLDLFDSPLIRR